MKNVLLLRLIGPMQSWGVQSQFTQRDTGLEPSKSGIIGLLCAALGKPRYERSSDGLPALMQLASLLMGVRVDRPGILRYDYHIAQNVREANAKSVDLEKGIGVRDNVSKRYYLADAAFLVGLGSDDLTLLRELDRALANPVWPLFLGRKSFVSGAPVRLKDGLREGVDSLDALRTYDWLGRAWQKKPNQLRFVIEHREGDPVPLDQPITQANDQPLSFDILNRRYAPRRVRTIIEPPREEIFRHLAKTESAELEIELEAETGG